jgi:alpha-methylacyl-CoA racemase
LAGNKNRRKEASLERQPETWPPEDRAVLPLSGYRLLDLTQRLPGPLCSLILADVGMEVIKVEEPDVGDYARHLPPFYKDFGSLFFFLNRNKKSLTLNLKSEEGRKLFLAMAGKADVILEGFRPGLMESLGLDYEKIRAVNEKIIYCSLSGYGQDGPYRDKAGHDVNYNALCGILGMTGNEAGPALPGVLVADVASGITATLTILLSLLHRERHSQGQHIDLSMFDVLFSWFSLTNVSECMASDEAMSHGKTTFTGKFACYDIYRTKDNQYMSMAAMEPKFWREFCTAIGREDLNKDYMSEGERQDYLKKELTEIFRSKTKDEWIRAFEDGNFCCEPVKSVRESLSDDHVLQRKLIFEAVDKTLGAVKQLNLPFKMDALKHPPYYSPPPLLGQHTEDILLKLGVTPLELSKYRKEGIV